MAATATTVDRGGWPISPAGRVALLDVDPDLAAAIPPDRAAGLRNELTTAVYRLGRGAMPQPPTPGEGEAHLGFLMLKGLILREVAICGRPTAELLGPGDMLRPWPSNRVDMLSPTLRWTVLEQALLAELGPAFAIRLSGRPELIEALIGRSVDRAEALAIQRSIASHVRVDVRVLAFLWHLAERFGVVVPGAVRINVPLTHSVLARLVGARRPTVTTALQRLLNLGYLRRDARAFVLVGDAGAVAELESRSPSRDFEMPAALDGDTAANGSEPSGSEAHGDGSLEQLGR
jgi:CRP/FNR family transcriptional regulator, cyclic AMP receptor protein